MLKDEKDVANMLHDVTTGAFRKRRGKRFDPNGKGLDMYDSDEENEALLRQIRKRMGFQTSHKDKFENGTLKALGICFADLAADPKTRAFAACIDIGVHDTSGFFSSDEESAAEKQKKEVETDNNGDQGEDIGETSGGDLEDLRLSKLERLPIDVSFTVEGMLKDMEADSKENAVYSEVSKASEFDTVEQQVEEYKAMGLQLVEDMKRRKANASQLSLSVTTQGSQKSGGRLLSKVSLKRVATEESGGNRSNMSFKLKKKVEVASPLAVFKPKNAASGRKSLFKLYSKP